MMYAKGQGVKKDLDEAQKWIEKSANQGNANAQYELGMIYAKGLYNDLDTARLWWRKAANQGHEKAKKKLNSIKK